MNTDILNLDYVREVWLKWFHDHEPSNRQISTKKYYLGTKSPYDRLHFDCAALIYTYYKQNQK